MWNFQRIICIWICCVSCMFGTTQLSSLVRAVPYEYFDDHEQSFYDLDSEQIQAKYDTRLLSQQMLQTQQHQQQHLENLNGFHIPNSGMNTNDGSSTFKTKLKSNDGQTMDVVDGNLEDGDDERRDWLEETATKAAGLTPTITETFDELHLPRAASCFTNGHKFTHGQKVPRLDSCEVCLCMDGEIFCWWEKCDKISTKASTTFDAYSTPIEESSTTRIQLNPKTTFKTTLKPMKKPKTSVDYKYDDDDSAELREMQQEYENLKDQLMSKEQHEPEQHGQFLNKQATKKKMHLQQGDEKYNRKFNELNRNKLNNKKKMEEQQQKHKKQKQHKYNEQHYHTHNHNNNNENNKDRNNNHDYGSSSSSSKILNFPENLPSVLYYDYKTEEHHQHQHQHREQHLKHQKQKQQQQLLRQHEKELKHQHEKQQQQQQDHVNRHHEFGQDFNTYISSPKVDKTLSTDKIAGNNVEAETKHHTRSDGSSTTFKYLSNGNENIFNEDLQTDSDILPEPPTKKPKFFTSITGTTAAAKTTPTSTSQLNRISTAMMPTTESGSDTKATTTTSALTSTSLTASISLKKQMFSPWDYNGPNRDKTNGEDNHGNGNNNYKNNESADDILDTDDQDGDDDDDDDAFHRWLTSTETNNKNNFTLNDAIIARDDFGLEVDAAAGGGDVDGVPDDNTNDYNVDERNYENMDLEINTERSAVKTVKSLTMKGVTTTTAALNTLNMEGAGGGQTISNRNIQKPTNEQNFNENKNNKSHSKGIIYNDNDKSNSNSNTNTSNNNSPFSSNSFDMDRRTSSSAAISGAATSNEENGVASVVNIDIMLTASSADLQQQPQGTNMKTTSQQQQFQLQEKQKFLQSPVLISNANNVDNNNTLYSIINDNNRNFTAGSNNSNKRNKTTIAGDGTNIEGRTQLQNVGVNLSSTNNNFDNNSQNISSSGGSLKFNRITALVPQTNSTPAAATPPLSTTLGPERQCNVMGTLYKIGDVLPQDTGNCLQCICIDGSTSDDTPRVTCSPHNCPPLVLPDLFDATGY